MEKIANAPTAENDRPVNPVEITKIDIKKHMLKDPRRAGQIDVMLHFPKLNLNEEVRGALETAGNNCPVAKSLHPDLKMNIEYNW